MTRLRVVPLVVLVGAIAFVIERQLEGKVKPDATTVALIVVLAGLVLTLLYPRHVERLAERVSNVKLVGIEVALIEAERSEVVDRLPEQEEAYGTIPVPPMRRSRTTLGDLHEISRCLRERLDWLAKELQLDEGGGADLVRTLEDRELIDRNLARFVADLLRPGRSDVPSLPEALQEQNIERAWRFVNRFRPAVFDRIVRKDLKDAGWFLADYPQEPHHRPDFLAAKDDQWILVAPRVALDPDSATNEDDGQIAKTRKRWERDRERQLGPTVRLDRRLIVIPENTRAPESSADDLTVLKRSGLGAFLARVPL